MPNKLNHWDEASILFVERICHWVQLTFGINNFVIAKLLVLISVIVGLDSESSVTLELTIAGVEVVVRMFTVFYGESNTKVDGGGSAFSNPLRVTPAVFQVRILLFFLFVVELFRIHQRLTVFFFLSWLFYVVVVCTPLPPGQSRIGNWFRGLISLRMNPSPVRS